MTLRQLAVAAIPLLISLNLAVSANPKSVTFKPLKQVADLKARISLIAYLPIVGTEPLFSSNAPTAETNEQTGDWSEIVNGLRGRLIFDYAGYHDNAKEFNVFLEIRNVRHSQGSLAVVFDYEKSLKCWVRGSSGSLLKETYYHTARLFHPTPMVLAVPDGSSLRVNIGSEAISNIGFRGGVITLSNYQLWQIRRNSTNNYFLVGELNCDKLNSAPRNVSSWYGTLKLPKVKIPSE